MNRRRSPSTPPRSARRRPAGGPKFRYPGASTNPLSKLQKGAICQSAREAFDQVRPGGKFEDWRRRQQLLAVGLASLTECTQENYLDLQRHFAGLAGEGGREFRAAYRQPDEELRQARHLLQVALEERGLELSYAEKLCRVQYKRELEKATKDQLFNLKFTVEQRRAKLAAATADPTANCPF